ncbi:MAG: hypothetical protein EZS28_045984 [Streblomastix strix]|uniref:Uncharacterized protein n=1 Tax=Streblomastix strix TaxID=222440 RepID=A0A5J4TKW6_9EUKA|nr:MAG: hypothetical protein EZS28_045984 [Streblomastix strix]
MDFELQLFTAVPKTTVHYYSEAKIQMSQINYSLAIGAIVYTAILFPMMFIDSKINNFRQEASLRTHVLQNQVLCGSVPRSVQLQLVFAQFAQYQALLLITFFLRLLRKQDGE